MATDTQKLQQEIDDLTKEWSLTKYNFMKISTLKRLIQESEQFSEECTTCKKNTALFADMVKQLPFLNEIVHRQPYEKKFNGIRNHFHKSHGFIAPDYHVGRYAITGLLSGMLLALGFSYITAGVLVIDVLLMGLALGIITGYFIGFRRDAKFRRVKKML